MALATVQEELKTLSAGLDKPAFAQDIFVQAIKEARSKGDKEFEARFKWAAEGLPDTPEGYNARPAFQAHTIQILETVINWIQKGAGEPGYPEKLNSIHSAKKVRDVEYDYVFAGLAAAAANKGANITASAWKEVYYGMAKQVGYSG